MGEEEYEDCPLCGEPNEKGFACRYVRKWRETGVKPSFATSRGESNNGRQENRQEEETPSASVGAPDQSVEAGAEAREEEIIPLPTWAMELLDKERDWLHWQEVLRQEFLQQLEAMRAETNAVMQRQPLHHPPYTFWMK